MSAEIRTQSPLSGATERSVPRNRSLFYSSILAGLVGLAAQPSGAALLSLIDDNSVVNFDTATPANAYNWFVDGVDQLNQQAFWFRIGNVGPETSLHTLPIGLQGTTDANFDGNPDTLFVRYNGAGFRIETRYTLDGGLPGSQSSDMGEQISISNLGASPLDFHFFQYSDFDLLGTAGGDSVLFTNPNTVRQFKPGAVLTETVVTPPASHREGAAFPITLNALSDAGPTTLSDTPPIGIPLGPGDMTWAFEWDFILQPGDTFQISKDKNINIPEPATGVLLSLAAGLIVFRRRKH